MLTGKIITRILTGNSVNQLEIQTNNFLNSLPSDVFISIQYTSFLQGANQRHNALITYYAFI